MKIYKYDYKVYSFELLEDVKKIEICFFNKNLYLNAKKLIYRGAHDVCFLRIICENGDSFDVSTEEKLNSLYVVSRINKKNSYVDGKYFNYCYIGEKNVF